MEKSVIDLMIEKARMAQQTFANYSQEQVDQAVLAIGKAVYANAELLSQEAMEETGFGRVDSKIFKHRKSCLANWAYMKGKKSVGVIDDDLVNQVVTYAKPLGVVACISPSTNPTSTPASNAMSILKCCNAMIVAPHPKAKNCTTHVVEIMRQAIKDAGAPADLIQILEEPSLANSQELMSKVDTVVATGGAAMVKAAYSSGKPSFGVGQGNVQVLVAEDYTDFKNIATIVANNRNYDNGIPCTGEQAIHVPKDCEQQVIDAFIGAGAYLLSEAKTQELQALLFKPEGTINPKYVGLPAAKVAACLGLEIPADTKILLFKGAAYGSDSLMAKEKLCPVLQYYLYDSFENAVQNAKKNLLLEGAGHSAVVYSNDKEIARTVGGILPVGRIVVNQPASAASGSSFTNGLPPTISLGCGSWGNNSISENLNYKHLMNFTKVAYKIEGLTMPSPEEIWGE